MSGHHQLLVWCILISYQSWFFDRILMYSSLCQMLAVYFVNFVGVLFLLAGLFSMPQIVYQEHGFRCGSPFPERETSGAQVNYRMSLLLHPFSDDGRTTSQVWKGVNVLRGTDSTGSSVLLGFLVVRVFFIRGLNMLFSSLFCFNNVEVNIPTWREKVSWCPLLKWKATTVDCYLRRKRTHFSWCSYSCTYMGNTNWTQWIYLRTRRRHEVEVGWIWSNSLYIGIKFHKESIKIINI